VLQQPLRDEQRETWKHVEGEYQTHLHPQLQTHQSLQN
jgi:hypothetical protein